MADENNIQLGNVYPQTPIGDVNILQYVINQYISAIQTASVVKVTQVNDTDEINPVGTVSVQVLVNIIGGDGNAVPLTPIQNIPYFRLQGGGDAIVVLPKVGDIGLAVFTSSDNTVVKKTKAQSNPGSRRKFSMSDGMYFGGFLNGVPTQFLQFLASGILLNTPGLFTAKSDTTKLQSTTEIDATAPVVNINSSNNFNVNSPIQNNSGLIQAQSFQTGSDGSFNVTGPSIQITALNGPVQIVSTQGATINGQQISTEGGEGGGSVSSVGLADTSATPIFDVGNSPITSSGVLALKLKTQAAQTVLMGPVSGANTQPTFRFIQPSDVPTLNQNTTGSAATATFATTAGAAATAATATFATTAGAAATAALAAETTNLAGGTANQIAYQTGANVTGFMTAPTISNTVLTWSGSAFTWVAASTGGVTSVGLSAPSVFSVSGSPVTSSGTLALTFATGQTANQFLATPNGSTGAVGLRAIVAADIPTLNQNTTGSAATATLATTATNLAGGANLRIAYQTAAGTTSFVAAPTVTGSVPTYNGSSIVWSTPGVGALTVGSYAGSTGANTQANATVLASQFNVTNYNGSTFNTNIALEAASNPTNGTFSYVYNAGNIAMNLWGNTSGTGPGIDGGTSTQSVSIPQYASGAYIFNGSQWYTLIPIITAGTGISVTYAIGKATIANTGITSVVATAHQTTVSTAAGVSTIGTVQNIDTTSSPTFAGLTIGNGGASTANIGIVINGTSNAGFGTYFQWQNNGSNDYLLGQEKAALGSGNTFMLYDYNGHGFKYYSGGVKVSWDGSGNGVFAGTLTSTSITFGGSTLSHYDEGTWTPGGNGITFTSASGTYTRIGNRVFFDLNIVFPSTASTNSAQVTGLPVTVGIAGSGTVAFSTLGSGITIYIGSGGTVLSFRDLSGNPITNATMSSQSIIASGSYRV